MPRCAAIAGAARVCAPKPQRELQPFEIARVGEHREIDVGFIQRASGFECETPARIRFVDPEEHRAETIADRVPARARQYRAVHVARHRAGAEPDEKRTMACS